MPVGTAGTVKGLTQESLEELDVGLLLANTYHLYLRPGHELMARMGGLHQFMAWPRGILTDSGGYQVFSLADLRKVTDEGVRFRSHLDGTEHMLTPEKAVEIQRALGSDIAMVLDECIEYPASRERAAAAATRTVEWARRSAEAIAAGTPSASNPGQAFFAIVQGGGYRRSAARKRGAPGGAGFSRLCRRRAGGRRAARADLRNHRGHDRLSARGEAALPDGRGQARADRRLRALRH